jgi:tetratricopeptide (TPR) repeat protein
MKNLKMIIISFIFFTFGLNTFPQVLHVYEELKPGKYPVGFQLQEVIDNSRVYPSGPSGQLTSRVIRVYLWYPAQNTGKQPMILKDYVNMAAADFFPEDRIKQDQDDPSLWPVPLKKGISEQLLAKILKENTIASKDVPGAKGPFPLIVLGQGLYYESPLSQFILCEFLASHGYVIATCPLVGDHYRLVYRDAADLEVHVRDLEFVLGHAKQQPFVDANKIGVIGYDLAGMAGLLLVMRNPHVKVFLSMDSGIDYEYMPIPKSHFSYRENNFTIPWMHMTESRFVDYFENQLKQKSLIKRKKYGPSYLVKVPTTNHGCFTSYAALGLQNPVTAYWGPIEKNLQDLHVRVCRQARLFFDAYLKEDEESLLTLKQRTRGNDLSESILTFDYNEGLAAPPRFDALVHAIISRGFKEVKPEIEQLRKTHAPQDLFDEEVLNWLGYHFLFWWDRPREALEVFKLNTELFPESANAFDSLGGAYLTLGDKDNAILSYQKSLQLNPQNENAKTKLKQLSETKDK